MPVRRTGRKAHAIAVFLIAQTRALAIGVSVTGANIFLAKPPRSPRGSETVPLRALRLGEKSPLLDVQMRRIQPEPSTYQGLGNKIPIEYEYPDKPAPPDKVKCDSALGGLLNHYYVDTGHSCNGKAA
jgi:hypothetical protein